MAGGGDEVNGASLVDDAVDMDVVVDGSQDEAVVERVTLEYEPTYQRFVSKEKTFTQQYSHLYTQRLVYMRPLLKEAVLAKWGGAGKPAIKVCEQVIDLEDGQRVIVIGTVFKDMPLRPSVLDEYRDEATLAGTLEPVVPNFTSDKDVLVLEDDSGRVTLGGDRLPVRTMCTGMVVAVVGEAKGGCFVVEDYCQAGMAPQKAVPSQAEEGGASSYVLLLSGLRIGEEKDLMPLQMLIDYVGGHLGGMPEQREVVSRIGRVIIAGDLLKPLDAAALKEKHLSLRQQQGLTQPLRQLDLLLSQLAAAVPVDIMPGSDDPCNYNLPQQPMHRCLLPRTSRYSTLRLVTNPYEARVGGRLLLGSSGQIADDMAKVTSREDGSMCPPLQILEETLAWRHMAPTAPDTLPCHPFCHADPFIIKETPHVYFTANQGAFATSLVTGEGGIKCRTVVVPSFHTTQEAVLVDLRSLDAQPVKFRGLDLAMMGGEEESQ